MSGALALELLHAEDGGKAFETLLVASLPVAMVVDLPVITVIPLHLPRISISADAEVDTAGVADVDDGSGIVLGSQTKLERARGTVPDLNQPTVLLRPADAVVGTLVEESGVDGLAVVVEGDCPCIELGLVDGIDQSTEGTLPQAGVDDLAGTVGPFVDGGSTGGHVKTGAGDTVFTQVHRLRLVAVAGNKRKEKSKEQASHRFSGNGLNDNAIYNEKRRMSME